MKNLYINVETQEFVVSKDKPLLPVILNPFFVGDVKDYAFYFVKSDKTYENVSGSTVKVALSAPRPRNGGEFELTIGDYSGSFSYNSSPSTIIAELLSNGIEAEIHGRDGAYDFKLLNTTASLSIDIKNLQPECSGYVDNYSASAYQCRFVPKPYGYLEGIANITSGSSIIGFSGSFNLATIQAVSAVGSRDVACLFEVEKDTKTVVQKEVKLINEIINNALNDYSSSVLPHFLTNAIVDSKMDSSASSSFALLDYTGKISEDVLPENITATVLNYSAPDATLASMSIQTGQITIPTNRSFIRKGNNNLLGGNIVGAIGSAIKNTSIQAEGTLLVFDQYLPSGSYTYTYNSAGYSSPEFTDNTVVIFSDESVTSVGSFFSTSDGSYTMGEGGLSSGYLFPFGTYADIAIGSMYVPHNTNLKITLYNQTIGTGSFSRFYIYNFSLTLNKI